VDQKRRQLAYTSILSPVRGIARRGAITTGDWVHGGNANPSVLATITQLTPSTVVFSIPTDVPRLLERVRQVPVEAWTPDNTTRIATGRLIAADSPIEIDTTTGTASLKALFDNDDNALVPNQAVNIRLLLN
jgi:multidrug efflux system membrane fusion protein